MKRRVKISIYLEHVIEDCAGSRASEIEVRMVREVNDGGLIGNRIVNNLELGPGPQHKGDHHLE